MPFDYNDVDVECGIGGSLFVGWWYRNFCMYRIYTFLGPFDSANSRSACITTMR